MLIENERGHYAFLKGIAPYSSGAAALSGYEIVYATLKQPLPWREGFECVDAHLQSIGRDRHALCGMVLRCPEPYSMQGFVDFNGLYCSVLEEWGLYVDDMNPVARTNVSPEFAMPEEPALYAFSYTIPADHDGLTFVAAGAGELNSPNLVAEAIIRRGDLSVDAMREKAAYVMDVMEKRLTGLGGTWGNVTAVGVYTVHPIIEVLKEIVFSRMDSAAIHGVQWFQARPPILEIEFEMDLRGVKKEIII
jgi:hypothetical protein